MTYVDGFVTAVPKANKDLYLSHARAIAERFKEWGATRIVETWDDDVPEGEHTDFRRAVAAKPDEAIVFSWIEYPDKATRDRISEKMMSPEGMAAMSNMPFDGRRMIFGGFNMLFAL